ncbi:MAG: TIR domain-containing protein, partial [Clostridia bacterium]|nr:TIR domain-containing protein [Clostridia bacterium]
MAVIKCKMCGGDLLLTEGSTVAECEYCGSVQTVPTADNEKKLTLFARANRLRAANEFDKAAGVYESIVADFPEEAEAYWGLVLCKFGIEYVDDPATGKKIPTCHRSGFDSVMKDSDFEQACENADPTARRVYREEAKQIEEIRKRIIEVSGKEEPYDIFICYKETDAGGKRTVDSVIAQNVYDKLTESGYRVFFSRITLEDKLGLEYEPYIFAALNSAKVMLVFGTDYEHFNAVWVKNEWSRFLKLMAADKTKYLIPCYKDIDAYDMPEEFAHLQAQDMGKVGAEQDLIRGIKKLLPKEEPKKEAVQQTVQAGPSVANYLKLGDLALEDGDWDKAKSFFDQALAVDAECADAYLGHALAAHNVKNRASIAELGFETGLPEFKNDRDFAKFLRFAADDAKKAVDELMAKAGEKAKNNADRLKPLIKTAARIKDRFAFDYRTAAALKTDGTVLAAGNGPDLNKAAEWKNVAAIALNDGAPFAYRADGTWVCSEKYMSLPDWQDVISIAT